MSTVHTEYGPGRIIAQETVRGRTRYKVAGEGFEVWVDQTKLGGYAPPAEPDLNAPHWDGYDLGDTLSGDAFGGGYSPVDEDDFSDISEVARYHRDQLRADPDYMFDDDPDARYARLAWAPMDDDNSTTLPYNPDPQHDAIGTPGDDGSSTIQPIHHIDADERLSPTDSISFDDAEDGEEPGPNPDLFARQAWFSPNTAKGLGQMAVDAVGLGDKINLHQMHDRLREEVRDQVIQRTHNPGLADKAVKGMDGGLEGGSAAGTIAAGEYAVGRGLDRLDPGYNSGWGKAIKPASRREANPAALVGPALRVLGPMAVNHLMNGGGHESGPGGHESGPGGHESGPGGHESGPGVIDEMMSGTDPGSGWDGVIAEASYRPAGLSDRYIDITAGADYHNDPVAQFRHDPDAYINRVGHLLDEGLNPRFAEYMDLVEGDSSVRTAAWKDVRAKAMRLKTSGAVHVKDIAPNRIMASVDGDHGTYDVLILKDGSFGGLGGGTGSHAISNWHCGCEWGRWAFRRKFTYVGRLCSHAYASYLTMQSAHMTNQPRAPKRPPRKAPSRALPFLHVKRADNLQNGPQRLTPELVVNDADDAHLFVDVERDERDDTGPDDVVSDKDIVHFARLMRHCEVTQQPYPRQLVAFLARYAGCADDASDDTQTDYEAHDADDADEYLDKIRSDADRKQEDDFGNMADRVHKIQDAVEEARAHGADADRFVAMVRKIAEDGKDSSGKATVRQDGGRTLYRNPGDANTGYSFQDGKYVPIDYTGKGSQGGQGYNYDFNNRGNNGGEYTQQVSPDGKTYYRNTGGSGVRDTGYEVGPDGNVRGVRYTGEGENYVGGGSTGDRFEYDGKGDIAGKDFQDFLRNNPGLAKNQPAPAQPSGQPKPGEQPKPGQPQQPGQPQPSGQTPQAKGTGGTDGKGGTSGTGTSGTGGTYTAPGGGQTSGTIADGGVAGAENGNNSAITKNMLDADGNYTVQKGDTWSDIAQRTTGDMNNYQKMYDVNKGVAGGNIDSLAEGTKINLKDFANDVGNNGVSGDKTNPAGGGVDKNPATTDAGPTVETGLGGLSTANGFAGGAPKADTSAAAGGGNSAATPPTGNAATVNAVKPAENPASADAASAATSGGMIGTAGEGAKGIKTQSARRPSAGASAKAWLRWAAEADGTTNTTADSTTQSPDATTSTNPTSGPGAAPGSRSAPATNPAQTKPQPGSPSKSETYDPANPAQVEQQSQNAANPGAQAGGSNSPVSNTGLPDMGGMGMGDIGSMIGQGVGAASDIASGIGGMLPGLASGIGGAISGIFSSKQDAEDWHRYAYPAGAGDDDDPKTLPHLPFAGSGNPGSLEFTTSEEYADTARKKMDDVTDLGGHDLSTPMGEWQKQGSYDEATDDNSDIVRAFQASMGGTFDAPASGGGRFDDIAGAAAGFLRTAGRNYSLAEQSELIREGDKGGARNLDSLDLRGTHYEDMETLGR